MWTKPASKWISKRKCCSCLHQTLGPPSLVLRPPAGTGRLWIGSPFKSRPSREISGRFCVQQTLSSPQQLTGMPDDVLMPAPARQRTLLLRTIWPAMAPICFAS